MLFCRLLIFSKSFIFEKFFQEYHMSVKQIGSRSGPTFFRPDLGPNCLQRLSADDTRRQRVNSKSLAAGKALAGLQEGLCSYGPSLLATDVKMAGSD